MALKFELSVDGVPQLVRGFQRFAEDVKDVRPAWPAVLNTLRQLEGQQFASEGAEGGTAWAPLSPKYAAWKARKFPGRRVLVLTGDLRESLTYETGYSIADMQPLSLVFGTAVPYAIFHQRGTSRMPARKPINFSKTQKNDIVRVLHVWLQRRAVLAGLYSRLQAQG